MSKAFGSGYFGEWIQGEYGLPAYRYDCNQLVDDKAVTQTNEAWAGKRDHLFMFGNDRIVVTNSNYGYSQIRQDEGTPKYLTDYDPKKHQYGGGFGYLVSNDEILSTYYTGNDMVREYGTGYYKKVVKSDKTSVEQLLFAPYGDDPVVINRIKITNTSKERRNYKWHEYWAGEMYQFTFTQFAVAQFSLNTANVSRLRRSFARSFYKQYTEIDNGISKKWKYHKKGLCLRAINGITQGFFRRTGRRFYDMSKAYAMDYNPPEVLLISLNNNKVSFDSNASHFFGKGGVNQPDALYNKAEGKKEKNSMMMLIEELTLEPDESIILNYAYMYIPAHYNSNMLIDKYKNSDIDQLFKDTCVKWSDERVKIDIEGMEWLDREMIWHNSYLRGGMTYSSFYNTHILSQGGHYQYLMGLQGAPRDQLQHPLSYMFVEPWIAREHILFTLKQLSSEGELPYATTGEGLLFSFVMVPSDLQLMLLSFAGEYVLTTRDKAFLDQTYQIVDKGKTITKTVREGLLLAYKYATEKVGKGPHGLIRMKSGDWNDQAVYGRVPMREIKTIKRIGESMLNSAMAIHAFDVFARMLLFSGDKINGEDSAKWSKEVREAVREQWNGKWMKRAWMGDRVGWLGDDLLWLEPQPWTLIGDALDRDKALILAENIDKLLMQPNPNGAQLISYREEIEEKSAGLDTGVLENGGIWPAINGYLVWGLSKVDGELAWNEWLRNSRAYQAEAYPDIWYGIWSGPDSVNSTYARYPGRTQNNKNPITGKREKIFKLTVGVDWEDYPVFNLHAHTWQQYTIFKLLGLSFNEAGFVLNPVIPKNKYKVESRIFSLSYDNNRYDCRYRPLTADKITIQFELNGRDAIELTVNDIKQDIIINKYNQLEFNAEGSDVNFSLILK